MRRSTTQTFYWPGSTTLYGTIAPAARQRRRNRHILRTRPRWCLSNQVTTSANRYPVHTWHPADPGAIRWWALANSICAKPDRVVQDDKEFLVAYDILRNPANPAICFQRLPTGTFCCSAGGAVVLRAESVPLSAARRQHPTTRVYPYCCWWIQRTRPRP